VPQLLDDLLKFFLPAGLSVEQRESERQSIHRFIRELNQIRKNHIDRDFSHSYVVNNVTALAESYPFVSSHTLLFPFNQAATSNSFSFATFSLFSHPTRLLMFALNSKGMSEISAQLDGSAAHQLECADCCTQSQLHALVA